MSGRNPNNLIPRPNPKYNKRYEPGSTPLSRNGKSVYTPPPSPKEKHGGKRRTRRHQSKSRRTRRHR